MTTSRCVFAFVFVLVVLMAPVVMPPVTGQGEAAPKVLPAAEAHRHVDEVATVEMSVRSTGRSRKEGYVFLNTHENYRSNQNFSIVFQAEALAAFRTAGIEDVEKHYFRKVIHVTGKIRHFKSVTDIQIERPDQIRVVGTVPDGPSPTEQSGKAQEPLAEKSGGNTELWLFAGALGVFGLGLGIFGWSRIAAMRREQPKTSS